MSAEATFLPERYRDPELVAHGGMAEVYRATDTSLGRTVAVKILDGRHAADETLRSRFTREAHAAARLSGEPGTVTIYDVGECDERPFIVMEYLTGGSLQDVLRREGRQPPRSVLPWLEQAAQALDRAHARGIVHRDVKPANLLLDDDGNVHVADFGVATAAGLAPLTQTGTVLGTAGYLAPEQAEGRGTTPATDCYALAVVAFELLTGSRPFENENPTAEAAAHMNAPVPSISRRAAGTPATADAVLERALAKDPARRYGSCAAFVAALRNAYAEDAGTTRAGALPVAAPRRRRLLVPALALLLLAAGLGAAVLATRGGGATSGVAGTMTVTRRGSPVTVTTHGATVTVTQQGTTVHETVTAQAQAPPATTSGSRSSSAGGGGSSLALRGYRRMQAGDYAGAVPLLEQAAQQLRGSASLAEAYNDYNLAFALVKTSGCSDRVLRLLDASQAIQGHRSEIDRLRHACRG